MLKFYFNGAPNPNKVALFLEEAGLPCELVPVDTRKGDQFKPEFLKVNPNGKVPAIDQVVAVLYSRHWKYLASGLDVGDRNFAQSSVADDPGVQQLARSAELFVARHAGVDAMQLP